MNWQLPTPQKDAFPAYIRYPELFSPPECQAIIEAGEAKGLSLGTVGNGGNNDARLDTEYRVAQTAFLKPLEPSVGDLRWVYKKLEERVLWTNRDCFGFDLTGFDEGLTFLRYDEPSEGAGAGHYDWHQDFGGGQSSLRKLTVVTQLSPPGDYDGCELKLFTNQEFSPHDFDKQGDTLIFPSWTPHRVTALTRGRRYAMAVWVSGPRFR